MAIKELKSNIYYVGAVDWDRDLFDALIPTPDGTSYNSYLIKGSEKVALIDTVDPIKQDEFFSNLDELRLDKLDYIVANHSEQDHSGLIPKVIEKYPTAKIITNSKCKELLKDFFNLQDSHFIIANDKDKISLGDKHLEFVIAPWVHWPDTMFTYVVEDKVLFTTDLFGSHYASNSLYVNDECKVYDAAKRYYAQIMMPFRNNVKISMDKIKNLQFDLIAPSHGPLHSKPKFILNAYSDWVSDNVKNCVVIPYVSMHGSTQIMVDYLIRELTARNIPVHPYNLINGDLGKLAMSIVDASTIVLATPTVLIGMHPKAVYATYLLNALRPKTRFMSLIGSYSWGSKVIDNAKNMLNSLKVEFLNPVLAKGFPKEKTYQELSLLAEEISQKHRQL